MKRKPLLIAAGCIALLAGAAFSYYRYQVHLGQEAFASTRLESLPLAEALVRAKTASRPILVDVSAIWCPTCRELDATVLADPKVSAHIRDRLLFVRLEHGTDEGQAFLKARNTEGFPNLWLLDSTGRDIRQVEITFDPTEFLAQLAVP